MSESTKTTVAAAVAIGYVIGRTKKGRLALTVASLVAGRKLPLNPQELIAQGIRGLRGTPQFAQLSEQLRGELLGSGRTMVRTAADRGLGSLADTLQERTRTLLEGEAPEPEGESESDGAAEDEPDEERDERPDDEPDERPAEKARSAQKRTDARKRTAAKTGSATRSSSASKTAKTSGQSGGRAKKSAAKQPPTRTTRRR